MHVSKSIRLLFPDHIAPTEIYGEEHFLLSQLQLGDLVDVSSFFTGKLYEVLCLDGSEDFVRFAGKTHLRGEDGEYIVIYRFVDCYEDIF